MAAFLLGTLTWNVLLYFLLQMLIITVVLRGMMAFQQWIYWRSWRVRTDLVILGHGIALLLFAAMTDFVDAGAPPASFVGALLHSTAVLWPLQLLLLGADLALRAARREAGEAPGS